MKKIKYSVGTDPRNRKSLNLALWRDDGKELYKVASFTSHTHAEMFIKDFGFPVSDSVKKILNTVYVSGTHQAAND